MTSNRAPPCEISKMRARKLGICPETDAHMAPDLVRNLGYWRRSGDIAVLPIPKNILISGNNPFVSRKKNARRRTILRCFFDPAQEKNNEENAGKNGGSPARHENCLGSLGQSPRFVKARPSYSGKSKRWTAEAVREDTMQWRQTDGLV